MARTSILLIFFVCAWSGALMGQTKAEAQSPPQGGFDSFILLVAPRDTITIKRQLRAATESVTQAESRRQQAETMRLGARGRIESKKVEMVRIKERINLAKKENREADRVGLEAERKAAEREKGLFERREELRQAEIDLETTRGELAGLT